MWGHLPENAPTTSVPLNPLGARGWQGDMLPYKQEGKQPK
jgi:hypothetical protein